MNYAKSIKSMLAQECKIPNEAQFLLNSFQKLVQQRFVLRIVDTTDNRTAIATDQFTAQFVIPFQALKKVQLARE